MTLRPPSRDTRRQRREVPPLDEAALEALALGYVARFATASGKLADYLTRKLTERGWSESEPPDVDRLIARMIERGYLDDGAWAEARAGSLTRRGYGARRIAETLAGAGIEPAIRQQVRPGTAERRAAVLALARRRGLGPFVRGHAAHNPSDNGLDPATRARQVAAILRAGHGPDEARRVVSARSVAELEEWADEARDQPD